VYIAHISQFIKASRDLKRSYYKNMLKKNYFMSLPTELTSFLYNYIGKARSRDSALEEFLQSIITSLNVTIWNTHRNNTKQWEKTALNITKNKKRFYRRNFRPDMSTSQPHWRHNSQSHNQNLNTRQPYENFYVHTKFLPYYKHNASFNPSAHIRWTSSNFLHSGS
jgi:hypothetical protein